MIHNPVARSALITVYYRGYYEYLIPAAPHIPKSFVVRIPSSKAVHGESSCSQSEVSGAAMSISMLHPRLASPVPSPPIFSSSRISVRRTIWCCASQSQLAVVNGPVDEGSVSERNVIRLGLPSKGRMASDTLDLLKVSFHLSHLLVH